MNTAKILYIENSFVPVVVKNREVKYRKDGGVKRTKNNVSSEQFVEPIRDINSIVLIDNFLKNKITNSSTYNKIFLSKRNRMLFIIGISVGLRVSDLIELKWTDIFDKQFYKFKEYGSVKEIKTGKIKTYYITNKIKDVVNDYLETIKTLPNIDDYIFVKSNGKKISDDMVGKIIVELTDACGINGNYYTHSLRKTCAYHMYIAYVNKNDPLALAKVQKFLNHRNQSDTLRYLGLDKQYEIEIMQELYKN